MLVLGYMENYIGDRRGEHVHHVGAPSRDTVAPSPDSPSTANNQHLYTHTPHDAVRAFAEAGLPIALRTAQRYCEREQIDAIRIDPATGEVTSSTKHFSWAINPASYDKQWARMREAREHAGQRQGHDNVVPSRDVTRHDATSRDSSSDEPEKQDAPGDDSVVAALEAEIKELNEKLIDAEVEKRAAHQARNLIIEQSREFVANLAEAREELGVTKAKLRALEAPKESGIHQSAA